jgi:hypothetical protein
VSEYLGIEVVQGQCSHLYVLEDEVVSDKFRQSSLYVVLFLKFLFVRVYHVLARLGSLNIVILFYLY